MKIRVELTVEIDPDAWEMTYGTPRDELRQDVKTYVLGYIQGSAAAEEDCITRVTLKS